MAIEEQAELHNQLAGPLIESIVLPVIKTGGGTTEILLLLESVMAGVVLVLTRTHGPECGCQEKMVDLVAEGVKVRLATIAAKGATKQ